MKISATVKNAGTSHQVEVVAAGVVKSLDVPGKREAPGSGVSGGEFLMLALATCFCNDVYREASRKGITVSAIEVEASAHFDGIGLAAADIRYRARVSASASASQLEELLRETDAVAEVHNSLRAGVPVQLVPWVEGE